MKASLTTEFFVFVSQCSWKPIQRQRRDITACLDSISFPGQREQESKGTEVISLRKVCAQRTWHFPEMSLGMDKCLFVGEEVGVSLHRNTETLSQNIVASSRSFLGPLHVQLICLVRDRQPNIRLSLHPHLGVGNFL